jgi:hypothetical protein
MASSIYRQSFIYIIPEILADTRWLLAGYPKAAAMGISITLCVLLLVYLINLVAAFFTSLSMYMTIDYSSDTNQWTLGRQIFGTSFTESSLLPESTDSVDKMLVGVADTVDILMTYTISYRTVTYSVICTMVINSYTRDLLSTYLCSVRGINNSASLSILCRESGQYQ